MVWPDLLERSCRQQKGCGRGVTTADVGNYRFKNFFFVLFLLIIVRITKRHFVWEKKLVSTKHVTQHLVTMLRTGHKIL